MEIDYPTVLKQFLDQGLSLPEAQTVIHRKHPGLRRRYEAAHRAAEAPAEPAAPAAASKSYQEVTDDTVRVAHGLSKREWAERKAAKVQGPESVSTSSGGRDYFTLIREVKQRRGCNFAEAAREVNAKHPRAWAEMLSKANGGRDFSHRIRK